MPEAVTSATPIASDPVPLFLHILPSVCLSALMYVGLLRLLDVPVSDLLHLLSQSVIAGIPLSNI